jgi:hypothetical protein
LKFFALDVPLKSSFLLGQFYACELAEQKVFVAFEGHQKLFVVGDVELAFNSSLV